jgi:hypothetical protein
MNQRIKDAIAAAADPFKLLTTVGTFTVSTVRLAPALAPTRTHETAVLGDDASEHLDLWITWDGETKAREGHAEVLELLRGRLDRAHLAGAFAKMDAEQEALTGPRE